MYTLDGVTAPAAATGKGKVLRETATIGAEAIEVFSYRPVNCVPGPLFIVFPGYNRKAEAYVKRARRIARVECMTVFVPHLDRERFPRWRYQRAGVKRRRRDETDDSCIGLFVRRFVDWARAREGRPQADYVLFGHSAGAQMLSRVAAYCPLPEPIRIVLANPSSYVAPSLLEHQPYGFGGIADMLQRETRLEAYLAQPVTIYLGADDKGSKRLDTTPAANRQGSNRRQRGQATFEAARALAEARGWVFNWRLVLAAGVAHSSRGMLRAPEMRTALGIQETR